MILSTSRTCVKWRLSPSWGYKARPRYEQTLGPRGEMYKYFEYLKYLKYLKYLSKRGGPMRGMAQSRFGLAAVA